MNSMRKWLRSFRGQTALVTGASRGLGRACALGLAEAGVRVIAVSRTAKDLEALAAVSTSIIPWTEDVTSQKFYSRIEDLTQLHILVNSAGMNRPLSLDCVDPNTLDEMIALNIRAVYRTSQSAARVMVRTGKGGSIIHVSSQMGHVGAANRSVYCMTKHAVEGLTKALAVELAPHSIRVNSIAPTFIATDLTRSMLDVPEFRRDVLSRIPLGRIGTPEDVVGAVLLLASPASALMTGDSLKIDGGWTAV
jgi:NAD(P)-dependent dehydrogenase (short-subunit alcohol dehydrogenase family)